jgi:beta-carotene 3-hydroxylase
MEPYSAVIHRVAWHGPLWVLHRYHHRVRSGGGANPNDLLSASHAVISMAAIAGGLIASGVAREVLLGVGAGLILYGALYFIFHDGMVHGRLPVAGLLRFRVCRSMKAAHDVHHQTNRAPYGFFLSPLLLSDRIPSRAR